MSRSTLYVTSDISRNLRKNLHSPLLKSIAKRVLHDADELLETEPMAECAPTSYLGKGRAICSRLENLTCAWMLTGDRKYREAAVDHLGGLACWNHIANPPAISMEEGKGKDDADRRNKDGRNDGKTMGMTQSTQTTPRPRKRRRQ